MDKKLIYVKFVYIYGAILDALSVLEMALSIFLGFTLTTPGIVVSDSYIYSTGMALALMTGWTFLLIWGYFRPIERKEILLMTFCPVVVIIFITLLFFSPTWILSLITGILFVTSYIVATKVKKRD